MAASLLQTTPSPSSDTVVGPFPLRARPSNFFSHSHSPVFYALLSSSAALICLRLSECCSPLFPPHFRHRYSPINNQKWLPSPSLALPQHLCPKSIFHVPLPSLPLSLLLSRTFSPPSYSTPTNPVPSSTHSFPPSSLPFLPPSRPPSPK